MSLIYQKQPYIRSRLINLTKRIEHNPQIKTLVKGMMLNHEEFELLQDASQHQICYPTSTKKITFSNVKPLRNKQDPQSTRQTVKPIEEFICESEEGFSVYPQNTTKQQLIISNNQLNLSSTGKKKKTGTSFRNLQIDSIESLRDMINLTTSIETYDVFKMITEPKENKTLSREKMRCSNKEELMKTTSNENYKSLFHKSTHKDLATNAKTIQSASGNSLIDTFNQGDQSKSKKSLETVRPYQSVCKKRREETISNSTYVIMSKTKSLPKPNQIQLQTQSRMKKVKNKCIFIVPITERQKRQVNQKVASISHCNDNTKKLHYQNKNQQHSNLLSVTRAIVNTNIIPNSKSQKLSNNEFNPHRSSKLQSFLSQSQNIFTRSKNNKNGNGYGNSNENIFLKKYSNIYQKLNETQSVTQDTKGI